MKILIFGAGVIGSIYASKLFETNSNVKLLARGKRFDDLARDGISLKDGLTGHTSNNRVPLVKSLEPDDFYDLIIVAVRLDQLDDAVADLQTNTASTQILFLQNTLGKIKYLKNQLPDKHVILGFPGAGGLRVGNQINYVQIKQQKTTIGEIDGVKSKTIKELKMLFGNAGFETEINPKMPDWITTHAVFISSISAAVVAKDDSVKLANDKSSIQVMVKSIREGFRALQAMDISIQPGNLKVLFMIMPRWFAVKYWQKALKSDLGKLAITPHALVATEEMQILAQEVLDLIDTSGVQSPNLDELLGTFVNAVAK